MTVLPVDVGGALGEEQNVGGAAGKSQRVEREAWVYALNLAKLGDVKRTQRLETGSLPRSLLPPGGAVMVHRSVKPQ